MGYVVSDKVRIGIFIVCSSHVVHSVVSFSSSNVESIRIENHWAVFDEICCRGCVILHDLRIVSFDSPVSCDIKVMDVGSRVVVDI